MGGSMGKIPAWSTHFLDPSDPRIFKKPVRCEIPTFAAKPPSSFEKIPICTADGSTFETVSSTESTSLVRQVRFWAFLMQPPALAALDIDCLDVNFTAELNQSCSMMIPSYDFCGAYWDYMWSSIHFDMRGFRIWDGWPQTKYTMFWPFGVKWTSQHPFPSINPSNFAAKRFRFHQRFAP